MSMTQSVETICHLLSASMSDVVLNHCALKTPKLPAKGGQATREPAFSTSLHCTRRSALQLAFAMLLLLAGRHLKS
eukprot:2619764-Amphidinium_carterae.1